MNIGSISGSESEKCIVCGRKTSDYKVYHQSGMKIVVPTCHHARDCFSKVDVRKIASRALTDIKQAVQHVQKGE